MISVACEKMYAQHSSANSTPAMRNPEIYDTTFSEQTRTGSAHVPDAAQAFVQLSSVRFPRGRPGCKSTALCFNARAPTVSLEGN